MTTDDLESLADELVGDVVSRFGRAVDPALLRFYTREVVLDLWMNRAQMTVSCMRQIRQRVLEALGHDAGPDGVDDRRFERGFSRGK